MKLVLYAIFTLSAAAFAQITTVTADQAPPVKGAGHDYIKLMDETVSPATGSVNVHIDFGVPPGREITVPFGLDFDSNSARHFNDGSPVIHDNGGFLAQGGWHFVVPQLQELLTTSQITANPDNSTSYIIALGLWPQGFPAPGMYVSGVAQGVNQEYCDAFSSYTFSDFLGTVHPLGINLSPSRFQGCNVLSFPPDLLQNTDGVVIATTSATAQLNLSNNPTPAPVTVFDHDGTVFSFSNALGHLHSVGKYFNTSTTHDGTTKPTVLQGDVSYKGSLPDFMETRNGNKVVFSDGDGNLNSTGNFQITDTLGRPAVSVSSFGNPVGDAVTVAGFSQPFGLSWGTASYNFSYNAHIVAPTLQPALYYGCATPQGNNTGTIRGPNASSLDGQGTAIGSSSVVTGIGLPNGLSYQFIYDNPNNENPFGLLRKIIYPNGAYVRYVWGLNPQSASVLYPPGLFSDAAPGAPPEGWSCEAIVDTPAIQKRFVSFDGVHEVQQQDFQYSTSWALTQNPSGGAFQAWTQKTTTVTTHDNVTNTSFQTVYTYVPQADLVLGNDLQSRFAGATGVTQVHPVEKTVRYFGTTGALLRSVTKAYSREYLPPDVLTTLDNGQSSYVHNIFASSSNVVTDIFTYDFGTQADSSAPGPHGPLLQHVHADYNHAFPLNLLMPPVTSSAPFNTAITDRPSAVLTYDGSGTKIAEIDYGYDETYVASASAVQHDDQNLPATFIGGRGNATTKTIQCFSLVNGSQQNCPQASSISTYTYDQTGQQVSRTDPNGNTISYSFADSFFDPNPPVNATIPPGNTNAYLTTITYPQTNGISHIESFSYAYSDGQLTLITDQNGKQTKYIYGDPLRRPTEVDFPDGGQITVGYNDSGSNPTVTTNKKITATITVTSTTKMDAMGHVIQTQANSDPSGVDFVDTTYDGLGRVLSVSNPHRSATAASDGVTTNQYDALSRIIQIIRQDGSISAIQYSGNCTTTTDEAGNSRKSCADALGRLMEVDEPQASSVGTSATASVTISGGLASNQTAAPPPALSGSGLAGFADSAGSQHWAYLGSNGHLYNLYWTSSGGYGFDDVTAATGAPAALGTAVTGFPSGAQQWAYFGSNGHVYNFWWNGSYGYDDATGEAGAPAAAAGSPLIGFADSGGAQHWAYFGTNQHVYNVYWSGGYGYGDVTGASGAPAAGSGSALTAFGDSSGGQHWSYLGTNQHVYNLYWTSGTGYGYQDATAGGSAPVASSTSRLAGFADMSGGQHWTYLDASGHGYNLYWNCCGSYGYSDLTSATGAPAASGNAIAGFMDSGGSEHWAYFTSSLDVLNFWWSNGSYGYQDATAGAGAPAATTGSALVGFKDPNGGQHWAYFGTNQHVYNVWWINGGYGYQDVNTATDLVYDAGTVSLNAGGFTATVCYGHSTNSACIGQPVNTTAAQVASALANAINTASSPATATVSGATINLTWKAPGPFTPSISALSTTHDSSSQFPNPSFTTPATIFANGTGNLGSNPYVTFYNYDGLGNLTCVEQHGSATSGTGCSASSSSDATSPWRIRRFTYDSLSRLLTAKNPESGTITYSYDANGNVLQKTSPAPNQTVTATQTISYCYDNLNRIIGKQYAAVSCPLNSPVVQYFYDQTSYQGLEIANGIDRLTGLSDQAGTGAYSYDALGRIITEKRTTAGISKSMGYAYNLDGSLASITYPSNAVVTYMPDAAGQVASAIDNGNNIQYVTGAAYGADNSLTGFVSGHSSTFNGITSSFSYNKRLQPTLMSATAPNQTVFSIGYDFHVGNGDNGNVFSLINYRDQTRTQTFTYDALNRLASARNAGSNCTKKTANNLFLYWGNTYTYDAWGNLTNKTVMQNVNPPTCAGENLNASPVSISNQLPGYSYDAAGNLTYDPTPPAKTYTYDSENRVTGAGGYTYIYDADGNRVEKTTGGSSPTGTIYWSMSPGIVAESDLNGTLKSEYVFFYGERIARKDFPGNLVSYYFSDHLKSASVITDAAGNITEDEDYYPWGGELQIVNNDSNHYKYGGHERDSETGLDYMLARYYSNPLGRFLTPDWAAKPATVPYANFGNPQSLNLYSYTKNNPTTFGDPDGHSEVPGSGACNGQPVCQEAVTSDKKKEEHGTGTNIAIGVGKEVYNQAKPLAAAAGVYMWLQSPWNIDLLGGALNLASSPDMEPSNSTQKWSMRVTFALSFLIGTGEESAASKGTSVIHHIATNKNTVFTPIFEKLFAKFGMTLEHDANKMPVSTAFHYSKHPEAYHVFILDKLLSRTDGKTGAAGQKALIRALGWLRDYIEKNPTILKK